MAVDQAEMHEDEAGEQRALSEAADQEAAEIAEATSRTPAVQSDDVDAWKEARRLDLLLYRKLVEPMPTFEQDGKPHITGEQAISRLNAVLGPSNWQFSIEPGLEPRYDFDEDVVIGGGTITVMWPSGRVTRHTQMGASKPNRYALKDDMPPSLRAKREDRRRPGNGAIMDLGDTYKACVTDIMKRCAMAACGVGLWLRRKDGARPVPQGIGTAARPGPEPGTRPQSSGVVGAGGGGVQQAAASDGGTREQSSTPDEGALWADIDFLLEEAMRRGERRWKAPAKKATVVALTAQIASMERGLGVTAAALRQKANGSAGTRAGKPAEEDEQLEAMGWPKGQVVAS